MYVMEFPKELLQYQMHHYDAPGLILVRIWGQNIFSMFCIQLKSELMASLGLFLIGAKIAYAWAIEK